MTIMKKGSKPPAKNDGNQQKAKPMILALLLVIAAGGAYYEFVYKKEQEAQPPMAANQVATTKEAAAPPSEEAPKVEKVSAEFTFGLSYIAQRQSRTFSIFEKSIEEEFKKNSIQFKIKKLDLRESAELAQASSMDFQLRDLSSLLESQESAKLFIPIEMSNKCTLKQSVFVKKETTLTSTKDLAGKKIIFVDQRPLNPVALNFFVAQGLETSTFYTTQLPVFALKMLIRNKVDAVAISYYDVSDKGKVYLLPIESNEFKELYQELPVVDSFGVPCMVVAARASLAKDQIESVKAVYKAYPKTADEEGIDHFAMMRPASEDELVKISEGIAWEKINTLKTSMKMIDPKTFESESEAAQ